MSMDLSLKYMWLLVLIGTILISVFIVVIFVLINKCISKKAKLKITNPHLQKGPNFSIRSNKYQGRSLKASTPPLPPRTQFLTEVAQSYENLAEESNYKQSTSDYEQCTPDYEQGTPDYEQGEPDYEQDLNEPPDYLQIEDEGIILPPPPPFLDPGSTADTTSTEDYDDIGGEDENQDEEDYDDVG